MQCVIEHFNGCPALKNEAFLNDLQHSASKFHAKDLFYVDSADLFCSKEFI